MVNGQHFVKKINRLVAWIAALPSVFGFAVAFHCVWGFGRTGHGTPSPMISPKKLVVVGFLPICAEP
jgi:hypothetical protein